MLWIAILAISFVVFIALVAVILPKTLLKRTYNVSGTYDRGVKVSESEDGKSIVYEPYPTIRKFVEQYALIEKDGRKFLVLKTDGKVGYIDYDIAVFDSDDEVITVLNVKEKVENGYCRELELPDDCSYIALILNEVNKIKIKNEIYGKVKKRRIFLYILSCALSIILETAVVKVCLSFAFAGLYRESFLIGGSSTLTTLTIALIASAINALSVMIYFAFANRKKGKERINDVA